MPGIIKQLVAKAIFTWAMSGRASTLPTAGTLETLTVAGPAVLP